MERIEQLESACDKVFVESTAEKRHLTNTYMNGTDDEWDALAYRTGMHDAQKKVDDHLTGRMVAYEKAQEGTRDVPVDPKTNDINSALNEVLRLSKKSNIAVVSQKDISAWVNKMRAEYFEKLKDLHSVMDKINETRDKFKSLLLWSSIRPPSSVRGRAEIAKLFDGPSYGDSLDLLAKLRASDFKEQSKSLPTGK